jgi:putative peptidoglycan lipid II flippase
LANGKEGGLSAYQAAFLFFQLPHAILAVSIMSALMPDLSERWARGDRAEFGRQLGVGLRTTAAVLIPAAVGYSLLAGPFIKVVLEHGRLSPGAAHTTAQVLRLFALGLPGFSLYLLLMRSFQAMKDTRTMFFLYAAENALTIVLALALYRPMGVTGLAVAFAAPYSLFTLGAMRRVPADLGPVWGPLARMGAASAGMAVVVIAVLALVDNAVARVGFAVALGAPVYVWLARAFGVEDLTELLRLRRRQT